MKKYKIVVICMCILLLLAGGVYAQQKTVRILAIGNSFSQDAVEQYLHELAEAEGISTIIGNMFIGGCSLERHVKTARENAPAYAYRKIGTDGKKASRIFPRKSLADLRKISSATGNAVGSPCIQSMNISLLLALPAM